MFAGTWHLDRADGISEVYSRVYVHADTGTCASVVRTFAFGSLQERAIEMATVCGDVRIKTTSRGEWVKADTKGMSLASMPSLPRAKWLWEVHRSMLARRPEFKADPLPTSTEARTADVNKGRLRLLEEMRKKGMLTRPNRRGVSRYTLEGAFRACLGILWPLKQRYARRVREREHAVLQELGLTELLAQAARDTESTARERAEKAPAGSVALADDRGVRRPVATAAAMATDDRRNDPRFRAIVSQSQVARQNQFRQLGWWFPALMAVAVVGGMFARLPPYVVIIGTTLAAFLAAALMNFGKAFKAEQAAADALLRRGLCASCLYALDGLEPRPDDCLICPECGAAWKRERVREFVQFQTAPKDAVGSEMASQLARARTAMGFGTRPSGWKRMAKDDRGERRALVHPRLRNELEAMGAPTEETGLRLQERLMAAKKNMASSGRWWRWTIGPIVLLLFVGVPVLPIMLFAVRGRGTLPGLAIVPLLVGAGMGTLLTWQVFRGNFGYRKSVILRAMKEQGLCPSCAEDMRALAVQDDGCVECVCGAAWRVNRSAIESEAAVVAERGPSDEEMSSLRQGH